MVICHTHHYLLDQIRANSRRTFRTEYKTFFTYSFTFSPLPTLLDRAPSHGQAIRLNRYCYIQQLVNQIVRANSAGK